MQSVFIQKISFRLLCLISFLGISACMDNGVDNETDFDRTVFLENYADKLIIPAYTSLSTDLSELKNEVANFTAEPTSNGLEQARSAWTTAYTTWQRANGYNFGPAAAEGLRKTLAEEIGTFPVNTTKIESAVSSGDYSLTDANRDARGFLTIEYLLFDGSDDEVLTDFSSENRKQYLSDVTANLANRVNDVLDHWTTSYRNEFISNDGTNAGSSVSNLFNEFVRSYETLKNLKLGLPLGLQSGQTSAEPTLVEAYYSGKSVLFLKAHVEEVRNIWMGGAGEGFDDYLETVTGGEALIESTLAQLTAIESALANVPESPRFSEQVVSAPDPGIMLHTELQKGTRYFKSDLSSLLGIAITFSSGDGD